MPKRTCVALEKEASEWVSCDIFPKQLERKVVMPKTLAEVALLQGSLGMERASLTIERQDESSRPIAIGRLQGGCTRFKAKKRVYLTLLHFENRKKRQSEKAIFRTGRMKFSNKSQHFNLTKMISL